VVARGIPKLGGLRQEDCKFKTSLGYTARACLKKKKGGSECEIYGYLEQEVYFICEFIKS
jgi:hypothetical protein